MQVSVFLSAVTEFNNLCLRGRVPVEIQPVFCGASLLALKKKDGGLRPIAVGNTLRRLVAKAACKVVTSKLVDRFVPVQLGFGVPRATEAAAHAARRYISDLPPGHGLLKLDFSNAFNNIRCEAILQLSARIYQNVFNLFTSVITMHHYCLLATWCCYQMRARSKAIHSARCSFALHL